MIQIRKTDEFEDWFKSLRDIRVKQRILARLDIVEGGNFGDCKPVGSGVFEMRIHYGAGYRLYYTRRGEITYLLLCGGDKSSQQRDIAKAIKLAESAGKEVL